MFEEYVPMTLDGYQGRAQNTAIYPDKDQFGGLVYTTLKLNGEAGEVAEKVGKIIRDKNSIISEEDRQLLALEISDVLWYVAAIAKELGYTLENIALMNLAKLADRKARGKLGGSGDLR